MSKTKNAERQEAEARETNYQTVRRGLWLAVIFSTMLLALVWIGLRLQDFLIHDPQFTLASPTDSAEEHASVRLLGLKYSAREPVAAMFDRDYGKSVYLLPLRQRRLDLLGLRWIRTARITRVWPNRVDVHLEERVPAAFVSLSGEDTLGVIDTEGAILRQETEQALRLPVAVGISPEQTLEQRRFLVRRILKLMRDAGPLADQISEVDVTDPDNLRVLQEVGGKAVILNIGNRGFRRRLEKFRLNAAEILRRDPGRTYFDLRTEGSIHARPLTGPIAAETGGPVE